jgi:anaerobic magnesium-protoporphyrin IX monomethyl ester cyclase
MKILLLNPPTFSGQRLSRGLMGGFGMRVGRALVYPPLQLAIVAAVLERDGHRVDLHDAEALDHDVDAVRRRVSELGPEVVVMACSQDEFDAELALARDLRRAHDLRLCLIGPMASAHHEQAITGGAADWVVLGEPEEAVATLLADVEAGERPFGPGIAYRVDGGAAVNDGRNRVEDLDALPDPARHLLDVGRYRFPDDPRPMTTIHASRGCPIGCPFCAYAVTEGSRMRYRDPARIVSEMEHEYHDRGTSLFVFRDPIFTLDRRRVLELCRRLGALALPIEWICETALRFLDDELIAAMRAAGCRALSFGVESANEQLQKKYARSKIGSEEHALEVVASCRRHGIETRAFFMLGFPEETAAMREETIRFACRLDPHTVQFVPVTLYEGTDLWEETHASGRRDVVVGPEVRRAVRRAYLRFYGRPTRLAANLRSPLELVRKAARFLSDPR